MIMSDFPISALRSSRQHGCSALEFMYDAVDHSPRPCSVAQILMRNQPHFISMRARAVRPDSDQPFRLPHIYWHFAQSQSLPDQGPQHQAGIGADHDPPLMDRLTCKRDGLITIDVRLIMTRSCPSKEVPGTGSPNRSRYTGAANKPICHLAKRRMISSGLSGLMVRTAISASRFARFNICVEACSCTLTAG